MEEDDMPRNVMLLVVSMCLLFIVPTGVQSAEKVPYSSSDVVSFSGSGTTTTKPFIVVGEWELQWKSKGFLAIHLYNLESRLNEKLMFVYSTDGGKGESYHPDAGEYFLNIVASEPWSISIRELKPSKK